VMRGLYRDAWRSSNELILVGNAD